MDIYSLLIITGTFFAAVIGNAAFFGDYVRVQIDVPPKLVQQGFTEDAAERIFWDVATRAAQVSTIMPVRELKTKSGANILGALAKPLRLDGAVGALQDSIGISNIFVYSAILTNPNNNALEMVVLLSVPGQKPERLDLMQEDGNPTALVVRGSKEALREFAPFRLACSELDQGLNGNQQALGLARAGALHALSHQYAPQQAGQRTMLWNLLGLMDLIDNKLDAADIDLQEAEEEPYQPNWAKEVVASNHAFLAIARGKPEEAQRFLNVAVSLRDELTHQQPIDESHWQVLRGIAAWSRGNVDVAEAAFRAAIEAAPSDPQGHYYLAKWLAVRGDKAEAAVESAAVKRLAKFHVPVIGLMQEEFWIDPVKGGITRRRDG